MQIREIAFVLAKLLWLKSGSSLKVREVTHVWIFTVPCVFIASFYLKYLCQCQFHHGIICLFVFLKDLYETCQKLITIQQTLLKYCTENCQLGWDFYTHACIIPLNEPCHEKTCLCHMWTTKAQISLQICAVWSAAFFHYIGSIISLVSTFAISWL